MHEPKPQTTPPPTPPSIDASDVVIRLSPIVFIGRLFIIELVFTLLATGLGFLMDYESLYVLLPFANIFSLNILMALLFTFAQVLFISVSFLSWYFEFYSLKKMVVTHRGGGVLGERELSTYADIKQVNYTQNRLQSMYNYGTIALTQTSKRKPVLIKNIPNPSYYSRLIRQRLPSSAKSSPVLKPQPLAQLIKQKENKFLEFKSSLQWDYVQKEVNKDLKKAVMKNVVAFLNTNGGVVVIGVDDNRAVVGLELDIQTVPKKNLDSYENILNGTFSSMVGAEYRQYIDIEFQKCKGKDACIITVFPCPKPVFLLTNGSEEFYIRTGNSSQPLSIKKALQYIQSHFGE